MAPRAKSICRAPACSKAIPSPGFCDKHTKQSSGWTRTTTQTTTARGYGHAWRRLREKILKRDCYLCQRCMRSDRVSVSNEVDHIINKASARAQGWTDEQIDDPSNLEAICTDCHKMKTNKENRS